ncbi:U4/U6-U5 snRNP complex subunit LSM6 [Aspergillus melleus]|uniref:U4/U6-U5 snRNP complex subunit LSM6 n=1 Tax=Aspergillus melleus TaxID=138277 RepID=UPI001E8CEE80|nr:U4/U6-U5 snRNP complex subunit lsm6 [Aspergillus melleus]KAH8422946.1 U4/U6-U5 snRNP complex subunit lsm6 [Aspergillus melleus]
MENGTSSEGRDPSTFLSEIIGAPVTVKLNSGVVYKGFMSSNQDYSWIVSNLGLGELQSVDGYMNIALEKSEEYVNGKLRRVYGDAFVRGNNGGFITSSASPQTHWTDICRCHLV